jgi:succinate dehydrogenase/fumarate reductase cytochrome b subunit
MIPIRGFAAGAVAPHNQAATWLGSSAMLFKILIVGILLAVVFSLFSGLFFLYRDRGQGQRAVRALTLRIGLSLVLFLTLILGYFLGYLPAGR